MIYNLNKKFLFWLLSTIFTINFLSNFTFAQENFEIIDKATDEAQVIKDVTSVWSEWWKVRENYEKIAQECTSEECLWNELASGIMTRNTLLRYAVKLVRRLSQAWLVAWAFMIIYAWYLYATEVFAWQSWNWNKAIKNAIIWVLVIAFSYAIMKLVISAFL